MFNLKHISITKKIGLLSVCALLGMLLIISAGLIFFYQIEKLGELKISAKTYEVRYLKTSFAFEQYVQSRNADEFRRFTEYIDLMDTDNAALPRIEKLFQQYGNVDDVYNAYATQYKHGQDTLGAVKLVKALKGRTVLKKLVDNCEEANQLTQQWRRIAGKLESASESEKAGMVNQVRAIQLGLEKLLAQFQDIVERINTSIAEVNQSASQMAESSGQVNMSSGELAALAERLSEMVARFKC